MHYMPQIFLQKKCTPESFKNSHQKSLAVSMRSMQKNIWHEAGPTCPSQEQGKYTDRFQHSRRKAEYTSDRVGNNISPLNENKELDCLECFEDNVDTCIKRWNVDELFNSEEMKFDNFETIGGNSREAEEDHLKLFFENNLYQTWNA